MLVRWARWASLPALTGERALFWRASGGGLSGESGVRAGIGASRTVSGAYSGIGAMPCQGKRATGAASSIQCATADAASAMPSRAAGRAEKADRRERAVPVIQGVTADAVPC